MDDRLAQWQRHPCVEAPSLPQAVLPAPIARRLRPALAQPAPARLRPELRPQIASVLDEFGVLRVADRTARDTERPDVDGMLPFLVVEHESRTATCTQQVATSGDAGIAPLL